MSEKAIEQEVQCLNSILLETESPASFYKAHELVDRNRITSNRKKILNAAKQVHLKPFRFFLNKN